MEIRPQYSEIGLFFFNDTATTEIYTLSLHDALPIYKDLITVDDIKYMPVYTKDLMTNREDAAKLKAAAKAEFSKKRSEEHTSELQSRQYLVCRLLLEKKKNNYDVALMA